MDFSRRVRSKNFGLIAAFAVASLLLLLFIVLFAVTNARLQQQQTDQQTPGWQRQRVSDSGQDVYLHNAVSSDSAVCSTMGDYVLNVLQGNAVDAAVTTLLCVGASNFHSAGIGGGSFMLLYNRSTKSMEALDFREEAPAAAEQNMYVRLDRTASLYGGLAVAVPTEVAGLAAAHSRRGRLAWRQLVEPVSQLLRSGQHVTRPMAAAVLVTMGRLPRGPEFESLRQWLQNPLTGRPYAAGDLLKDPTLADTMDMIAHDPWSFYNGSLADTIVGEIKAAGGIVSKADLRQLRPRWVEPLAVTLAGGLRLHSLPPPSSGAVLAFILRLLDGFRSGPGVKESLAEYSTFLHRALEAFKFGFAKRSALGDAKFVNVSQLLANLTSRDFAEEIRAKITDRTHPVEYYGPSFDWKEDSGTAHVSIVDSDGNAVAVTSTINTYFGSLVRGNSSGIIYNNEMDDFSTPNRSNVFGVPPSPSNYIAPRKKPMSSMAPAIVTDSAGDVKFVTGASGGTRITTAIAYCLARQIFLNETVKQAADAVRLHHQLVPNAIRYNPNFDPVPPEIRQQLEAKGHKLEEESSFSVVEGIQRLHNGRLQANADFRKPSKTSGY